MNELAPTPVRKRRWLGFSLRGLFALVSIGGIALGWYVSVLNWQYERKRLWSEMGKASFSPICGDIDVCSRLYQSGHPSGIHAPPSLDWRLRLIGERKCLCNLIVFEDQAKPHEGLLARIEKAFPEGEVFRLPRP